MNRKHFLSSLMTIGAGIPALPLMANNAQASASFVIPPYLKNGDRIGITSPAGYITHTEIQPAMQQMQSWGLIVRVGDTIGKRDHTFGGTDEERVADMQQMLDDASLQAVMCARGGYGMVRIIDKLNFDKFRKYPKWLIGFSDVTVMHAHLAKNIGIASIHSKMCNSFPDDWSKAEPVQIETILSIRQALMGEQMKYPFTINEKNKPGTAEGVLVGGNLKTIESLAGSRSDFSTDGKILFVEDTGEYLYSIDRMFWNLKRTGKLDKLAGLVVGGFKVKASEDPAEEFGKNLQEIVLEKVRDFYYPVCFDFPVGHQKNNFALKCGVTHRLVVNNTACFLTESR